MEILVPGTTDNTQRKDLPEFANRILQEWFRRPFSEHPTVTRCPILSIDDSTAVERRHGVPGVMPNDAAVKVIRKVNGALLFGKPVGVKRYDDAAVRAIGRY